MLTSRVMTIHILKSCTWNNRVNGTNEGDFYFSNEDSILMLVFGVFDCEAGSNCLPLSYGSQKLEGFSSRGRLVWSWEPQKILSRSTTAGLIPTNRVSIEPSSIDFQLAKGTGKWSLPSEFLEELFYHRSILLLSFFSTLRGCECNSLGKILRRETPSAGILKQLWRYKDFLRLRAKFSRV